MESRSAMTSSSGDPARRIAQQLGLLNFRRALELAAAEPDPTRRAALQDQVLAAQTAHPLERRAAVLLPVAVGDGREGAVLDMLLEPGAGAQRRCSPELDQAIETGVAAAWGLLAQRSPAAAGKPPPALSLAPFGRAQAPGRLQGESAGLAAALEAFRVLSGLQPPRPVIASGGVAADGRLWAGGALAVKLAAARREGWAERGALFMAAGKAPAERPDGLELHSPQRLEQAVAAAFGPAAAAAGVQPAFIGISDRIRAIDELIAAGDCERALRQAEQDWAEDLPRHVAVLLAWRSARASLHLGRPDARARYQRVFALLGERDCTEHEQRQLETEIEVSRIDLFDLDPAIARLRRLLDPARDWGPIDVGWQIHARGTLAMALAMRGRDGDLAEAVALREHNVDQQRDYPAPGLRDTLGRSLCALAWERFLAGDDAGARQALDQADQAVARGDAEPTQPSHNLYARARMLYWSAESRPLLELLERAAAAGTWQPEAEDVWNSLLANLRAAALLDAGRPEPALAELRARRITWQRRPGLAGWLVHLGLGFEIPTLLMLDRHDEAAVLAATAAHKLGPGERGLHPPAGRFYTSGRALDGPPERVATTVRDWYRRSWY